MVETKVGVLADVEGLPVQQGLLLGLLDGDLGFASSSGLGRKKGSCPEGKVGADARRDLEPAGGESVRHIRELKAGAGRIRAGVVGSGGGAGGVDLGALDGLNCAAGAGERVIGIGSGGGSLSRARAGASRAVPGVRGSGPAAEEVTSLCALHP